MNGYWIDANVWLDIAMNRERCGGAVSFLQRAEPQKIFVSEFAVYTIALAMVRHDRSRLGEFLGDLQRRQVTVLNMPLSMMTNVTELMHRWNLDFDDGLHMSLAQRFNLLIVSNDSDFDRTSVGRLTPEEALRSIAS